MKAIGGKCQQKSIKLAQPNGYQGKATSVSESAILSRPINTVLACKA